MEVNILRDAKDNLVLEMDNQTIAELFRVYLNEDDSVELAVWKREHPEKPVIFEIKTKGKTARKALEDAASKIEKETDKYLSEFKKAIK